MRRRSPAVLGTLLAAILIGPSSAQASPTYGSGELPPAHHPDRLVVDFHEGASGEERRRALASVGATVERVVPGTGAELLDLGPGRSVAEARTLLERMPSVRYAEPNFRLVPHAEGEDPLRPQQWPLDRINVPAAWNLTMGSRDVVVAVLDSGVEIRHPDLVGTATTGANLWTNPGETGEGRETNRIDDDANGYIDDSRGWNWNGDNHPDYRTDPTDFGGHGTNVAGVIGAVGSSGVGITGINQRVRIMPLHVWGMGSAGVAEAVVYAARHGVRVANGSFGIPFSQAVEDALAANPELLLSVSAGNQSWDVEQNSSHRYPCVSKLANVICVAATAHDDSLAGFSNWGATSVDLAAPGVDVLTLGLPRRLRSHETFELPLEGRWVTGGAGNLWARAENTVEWINDEKGFELYDSPGVPYEPNSDSWAQMAEGVDLTGQSGCTVGHGLTTKDLAEGDVLRVEASAEGVGWELLAEHSRSNYVPNYQPLSAFEGKRDFRLRFRLVTDGADERRGVQVSYTSLSCRYPPFLGDEYWRVSGTSFAAPHVAGAAALLLAHKPWMTAAGLRAALLDNVEPLAHLSGRTVTGGRLDVRAALDGHRPLPPPPEPVPPPPAEEATNFGDEPPPPAEDPSDQSATDTRAPRCSLAVPAGQTRRSVRRAGLRVRVRCDESARLSLRLTARGSAVDALRRPAPPGLTRTLRVTLPRGWTGASSRLRVALRATATDAAGNQRKLVVSRFRLPR